MEGVRQKLPYLKQLGVSVLYFNPIFCARTNHKYDTSDYRKVDPMFGDEQALARLCKEAEALGMRVMLDGVFSHVATTACISTAAAHTASTSARTATPIRRITNGSPSAAGG